MDKLVGRINRIEGQVRAVKRLYVEKRDCLEVVQQIAAARQALARVGKDILTSEAAVCAKVPRKQKSFDKILKTLFDIS